MNAERVARVRLSGEYALRIDRSKSMAGCERSDEIATQSRNGAALRSARRSAHLRMDRLPSHKILYVVFH